MNKSKAPILLSICLFCMLLMACPMPVKYSICEKGSEPIDKRLIGTWELVNGEEQFVKKFSIIDEGEESYRVNFIETGSLYTISTKSMILLIRTLNNKKYISLYDYDDTQYYLQSYGFNGNELWTSDVSFLDKGLEGVTSGKTLQEEIINSVGKPGWEADKSIWKKVDK